MPRDFENAAARYFDEHANCEWAAYEQTRSARRIPRMTIDAAISPMEIEWRSERDLSATTAIVFDVLRATSTMVTALANGAAEIHPVASIPEALDLKKRLPRALLAGERRGVRFVASTWAIRPSPIASSTPTASSRSR